MKKKVFLIFILIVFLGGCSSKYGELRKSPCADIKNIKISKC